MMSMLYELKGKTIKDVKMLNENIPDEKVLLIFEDGYSLEIPSKTLGIILYPPQ